jgi:RNA polymerase sigma factor (sigma-70 family)
MSYLYDHYSQTLFGIILRIVKNEDIAEEVLQDCLLRIWERIEQYDTQKGRFFTWMLNVSRNMAIDRLRTRERKEAVKTDGMEPHVHTVENSNFAEQNPETIGLQEIIDKLDEDHRLIIRLVYLEGYTHSEVANDYDIPLGTVKTRLRNALIHLRKILRIP